MHDWYSWVVVVVVARKFVLDLLENALLLVGLVGGCGSDSSGGCAWRLFVLVLAATKLFFDFLLYALLPPPSLPIILLFQNHIYR